MRLTLQRLPQDPHSTPGDLSIDGQPFCVTLELPVIDGKPGSAIPAGIYKIELQPSPKFLSSLDQWVLRFAHKMPHITGIPGRSLIMIHWLNVVSQTDGCVGVGEIRETDFIGASRATFEKLFALIEPVIERGEVCDIEILDAAA